MIHFLTIALIFALSAFADLKGFYLSWSDDPTTTIDIVWITPNSDDSDSIFLKRTEDQFIEIVGSHQDLDDFFIHRAQIKDLEPATSYQFHFSGRNDSYLFTTAPQKLDTSIRFVIGGDAAKTRKLFEKMNANIASENPLFCVIGGDIAYAIDNHTSFNSPLQRWLYFFSKWTEQMITKSRRVIPLIVAPGNHDVTLKDSHEFFAFFPSLKDRSYFNLVFGDYMQLLLLDTGHISPIEGNQTTFIERSLEENQELAYSFAVYHEDAYPSVYSYDGSVSKKIRSCWSPIFEKYHLSGAFENHSHAYKRTYPLKDNMIDPDGIIYFGDGCWGANPRKPKNSWYIAKKGRKNSVFLIDMSEDMAKVQAMGLDGKIFDDVDLFPRKSLSTSARDSR